MNYPVVVADSIYFQRDWASLFPGMKVFQESSSSPSTHFFFHVSSDLFLNYRWERFLKMKEEAHLLVYGHGHGPLSLSDDFSIRKIPPENHVDGLTFAGISLVRRKEEGLLGKKAVIVERKWDTPVPAFFLDRDGILIEDNHYVVDYGQVVLKEGLIQALLEIIEDETLVFVISNQSGVARGYFSMEQVQALHQKLHCDLQNLGLFITKWSFSPYHKVHGRGRFLKDSFSRKPYPGMVLDLCERFPIDLEKSWMIGDQITDRLLLPQLQTLHLKGTRDLSQAMGPVFSHPEELIRYIQENRTP